MALTQRQLKEVAEEALAAARAYEELLGVLKVTLARSEFSADAKVALLAHVAQDQPIVSTARATAALEHIERTSARNCARAERARQARKKERANERR